MVCSPCTSYTVSRTEAVIPSCQASPPARGVTNSPGRGICLDMWVPWASRVLVCADSVVRASHTARETGSRPGASRHEARRNGVETTTDQRRRAPWHPQVPDRL